MNKPDEIYYEYDPYLFNPLFWILRWALKQDKIRYIFVNGGSSAGKTFSIVQLLSRMAFEEKASTMVLRKFSVDIDDSVYADFKTVGDNLEMDEYQKRIKHLIKFNNDALIRFRGLDESEKLKGLTGFRFLYFNEFSLFDHADFKQARKRLRAMPGQKIIADWNPIMSTHWIKTEILDLEEKEGTGFTTLDLSREDLDAPTKYCKLDPTSFVKINAKGNLLYIKTTYLDNYHVVGHPSGLPDVGFRDQHVLDDFEHDRVHNENDYRVYALGEWGLRKTGGEFLKNFDETKHVRKLPAYKDGAIHITTDVNWQPYITIAGWQIDIPNKVLRQIFELPCKSPNNTALRSAKALSFYLLRIGYEGRINLYGDPAGNAHNANDDEGRSFYDKFIAVLKGEDWQVVDKIKRAHPSVKDSGEFVNEILAGNIDGWTIEINESCRTSIDDYSITKEDMNGGIDKKKFVDKVMGISYELNGHYTDSLRYLLTTVLEREFIIYRQRRHRRSRSVAISGSKESLVRYEK